MLWRRENGYASCRLAPYLGSLNFDVVANPQLFDDHQSIPTLDPCPRPAGQGDLAALDVASNPEGTASLSRKIRTRSRDVYRSVNTCGESVHRVSGVMA
jgi:hypothetical protein